MSKSFTLKYFIKYFFNNIFFFQYFRDFKNVARGGDEKEEVHVNNFWLKVLKSSYTEFISKRDEKILVVCPLYILLIYNQLIAILVYFFRLAFSRYTCQTL